MALHFAQLCDDDLDFRPRRRASVAFPASDVASSRTISPNPYFRTTRDTVAKDSEDIIIYAASTCSLPDLNASNIDFRTSIADAYPSKPPISSFPRKKLISTSSHHHQHKNTATRTDKSAGNALSSSFPKPHPLAFALTLFSSSTHSLNTQCTSSTASGIGSTAAHMIKWVGNGLVAVYEQRVIKRRLDAIRAVTKDWESWRTTMNGEAGDEGRTRGVCGSRECAETDVMRVFEDLLELTKCSRSPTLTHRGYPKWVVAEASELICSILHHCANAHWKRDIRLEVHETIISFIYDVYWASEDPSLMTGTFFKFLQILQHNADRISANLHRDCVCNKLPFLLCDVLAVHQQRIHNAADLRGVLEMLALWDSSVRPVLRVYDVEGRGRTEVMMHLARAFNCLCTLHSKHTAISQQFAPSLMQLLQHMPSIRRLLTAESDGIDLPPDVTKEKSRSKSKTAIRPLPKPPGAYIPHPLPPEIMDDSEGVCGAFAGNVAFTVTSRSAIPVRVMMPKPLRPLPVTPNNGSAQTIIADPRPTAHAPPVLLDGEVTLKRQENINLEYRATNWGAPTSRVAVHTDCEDGMVHKSPILRQTAEQRGARAVWPSGFEDNRDNELISGLLVGTNSTSGASSARGSGSDPGPESSRLPPPLYMHSEHHDREWGWGRGDAKSTVIAIEEPTAPNTTVPKPDDTAASSTDVDSEPDSDTCPSFGASDATGSSETVVASEKADKTSENGMNALAEKVDGMEMLLRLLAKNAGVDVGSNANGSVSVSVGSAMKQNMFNTHIESTTRNLGTDLRMDANITSSPFSLLIFSVVALFFAVFVLMFVMMLLVAFIVVS